MKNTNNTLTLMVALASMIGLLIGCEPGGFTGLDRAGDENRQGAGRQDRGQGLGSWSVNNGGGGDPSLPGSVGNEQTGRTPAWVYSLNYETVVLSPDGSHLLGMAPVPGPDAGWDAPGMVLVVHNLETGQQTVFDSINNVERVNFSPDGQVAFLLEQGGQSVRVLHLGLMVPLSMTYHLGDTYSVLDIDPTGRFLVASNIPTTDIEEALAGFQSCDAPKTPGVPFQNPCRVKVVDLEGPETITQILPGPIRDLDWSPIYEHEMVLTIRGPSGNGAAELHFFNALEHQVTGIVELPNCADELKLQPGGALALLSPTTCSSNGVSSHFVFNPGRAKVPDSCPQPPPSAKNVDPISVVNLETRTFIENLPGFGPVVISPDGSRAVGFTRQAEMQEQWGHPQLELVGLIVVDLATLEWEVVEYGDMEPAYLFANDGTLLTWNEGTVCTYECGSNGDPVLDHCNEAPANLTRWSLDKNGSLDDKGFEPVSGLGFQTRLSHFAQTPDGDIWAADRGKLVHIDLTSNVASPVFTGGFNAELITARPSGEHVILGDRQAPRFMLTSPSAAHAPKSIELMP